MKKIEFTMDPQPYRYMMVMLIKSFSTILKYIFVLQSPILYQFLLL